jgi:uncharacterized protein (DUF1697 family)
MVARATAIMAAMGSSYVALLRGINVGGKNKLPMSDLVTLFTKAGCSEVRTYIQSGNVVFGATPRVAGRIPREIAARIERDLGLRVPVIVRAAHELERVARTNPFLVRDADEDTLHVMFLASAPKPSAVSTLEPTRSPPDEFAVVGSEVYLRCPGGLGRSKLTNAYFDAKLATTSTCRNWRTVRKLLELATA